jgi:hypothetical protein
MSPILFIHIPKTAGISLTSTAEAVFGAHAIERDYGPTDQRTTENVRRHIYEAPTVDQFGFREATRDSETCWVTGHFPSDRYIHLFGAPNTITFLRDPVERVISEYRQRVRYTDYDGSLEHFYRSESEQNKQFKMAGQCPWKAYHLVGLQQEFDRSIALLAQNFDLPFKPLVENVTPDDEQKPVAADIKAEIKSLNTLDAQMVGEAERYLDKQFQVAEKHEVFCYHDVSFEPDVHFIGWAFYAENERPVDVELWVDGTLKNAVQASEHRPELQALATPRMGHNGFRFVLDRYRGCEQLELRTKDTGQSLFLWQRP